jgi:hypothetical protein
MNPRYPWTPTYDHLGWRVEDVIDEAWDQWNKVHQPPLPEDPGDRFTLTRQEAGHMRGALNENRSIHLRRLSAIMVISSYELRTGHIVKWTPTDIVNGRDVWDLGSTRPVLAEPSSVITGPESLDEIWEQGYIDAARDQSRPMKERYTSARKASKLHKKRTGRGLKVTDGAVLNGKDFEEM